MNGLNINQHAVTDEGILYKPLRHGEQRVTQRGVELASSKRTNQNIVKFIIVTGDELQEAIFTRADYPEHRKTPSFRVGIYDADGEAVLALGILKPMLRLQTFKYELMPDGQQERQMRRSSVACRFIFSKALALQKERHERGEKKLSAFQMNNLLPAWKKQPSMSWLPGPAKTRLAALSQ